LFGQLERTAANQGYSTLVSAAFCTAVDRRFTEDSSIAEIVNFVADVRTRHLKNPDEIDPRVAERLIVAVYTDEQIGDLSLEAKFQTQFLLLYALVIDEQYDESALDKFLSEARKLADDWLR
jgi:hypothetical protein